MGRICRILVRKYRISPLQIGRKYCHVNQVVKLTENNCGKESIRNVNTSETTSSFSLLQSRAVDEYQLIRNRRLPQKNYFTITEYMWQLLKTPNIFSPPSPHSFKFNKQQKNNPLLKNLEMHCPRFHTATVGAMNFLRAQSCREPD